MTSTIRLNIKNPSRPNDTPSIEARLAGTVLDVKRQLQTVYIDNNELIDMHLFLLFLLTFFFFVGLFPLTSCAVCSFQKDYPGNPLPSDIRIIFAGQLLRDDLTLAELFSSVGPTPIGVQSPQLFIIQYDTNNAQTFHIVVSPPPAAQAPSGVAPNAR